HVRAIKLIIVMEQPSSSSKVTVQYFDPFGVYRLLSPGFLPRLPLRNLHWESHAGPLRSISSLHVDLVPSAQESGPPPSADNTSSSSPNLSRVKSEDSAVSGDDGFRTQALGQAAISEKPESRSDSTPKPVRERRHQIPGLRQTPYLKVFLLRCDDNDTYKAQARKQVREWIKEHTPPAQTTTKQNTQENHDAFEWLIIHVVVPNTAAATQPKTSGKSSEGSSGSTAEKATARWRGGGSSTLLEKLRADFNGSSRTAVDRVAQIRIGINDVPYEMLPRVVPAIPGSYTESPQENENAWLDLLVKFKSLILASFDMRVSQYEEDIREKDAQRTLPGWNFCTFFVLKEGLARGFESVGLVEDALVGYDELAIGLDAIITEQATLGSGAEHGGSFLPFTEDLKQRAERAKRAILKDMGDGSDTVETDDPIDLQSNSNPADNEFDEIPLNAVRKRYRELILSNDISIFDFRCYIFARQLSLLLRLANAWSSKEELLAKLKEQRESSLQGVAARLPASQPSEDVENLVTLAHVCKRSMDFIASIARIIRDDIWASQPKLKKSGETEDEKAIYVVEPDPIMSQVVDNIASSFTFAVAQQILAQTSTKSLPIPPSTLAPPSAKIGLDGQEQKAAIPEPKTMMHPARSSSLAQRRSPVREPTGAAAFPANRRSSVPEQNTISTTFLKNGLEDLAAHRAGLYILSRNVLERVGLERGWSVGWAEVADHYDDKADELQDVDLEEGSSGGEETVAAVSPKPTFSLHGIESKLLRTAVDSKDDFFRLYETLTDKALRHYTVANRTQSVLANMADLAVLKYHLDDFAAAASYFFRMTNSYGKNGWDHVEMPVLVMYAKSLKKLQRKEDYVRVVLDLLGKVAATEDAKQARKSTLQIGSSSSSSNEESVSTSSYLHELLEITKTLQRDISVPLQHFFGHVEVDSTPRYHPEKDSFALQLRLKYLLSEVLTIEKARVRITALYGDAKRQIWLETTGPSVFKDGSGVLLVQTNMIVPDTYTVSHVSLHTSNITLSHEHESDVIIPGQTDTFLKCPRLLIYHRAEAFDVKLFASRYMHLDRNRSLELELSSGWNNVINGELQIRAATAGLRLQTSEAKVISGTLELSKQATAGVVRFGAMAAGAKVKLSVPYTLEHDSSDISLRLELSYTTENGTFFFATTPTMSILLPLGVNVQDVFKHKALFSKFTISSATADPLRLLSSRLEDSDVFEAHCGTTFSDPLVIFPRQPASMLYKITRSTRATPPSAGKSVKAALSLVLHYICLEEEIENTVTRSLEQALQDTPMYPYSRLVIPIVVAELRARSSPYDLERVAILSEVSTSVLSTVRWRDNFLGLGRTIESNRDIAGLISEGLQAWQQRTPNVPLILLSTEEETVSASRSIIIPVEVPSVTVVHTADLKLLESSLSPTATTTAASNQPLSASLNIKWTRMWDASLHQEKDSSSQPEDLHFVYEVTGSSDNWLIGGRRKGHFRVPSQAHAADSKQKLSFPVVLIPLREGFLPFPNVDIKPAPAVKVLKSGTVGHEEDATRTKPSITCETDHKNAGETIRVISDAQKTTVSLDASGPQGGAMLLESEGRGTNNRGTVLG
ncbi:Trafficking protein particle complex subunit, partial [Lachnellula occidentalis]